LSLDDNVTIASLIDYENETQQPMTSVEILVLASVPTPGKEKQKEVWFDRVLKKPSGLGLDVPFPLIYWHNWPIFQLGSPYTSCFAF